MPSGRVHAATTLFLTAVIPGFLYFYGFPLDQTIAAGAGCLTGLVLTPDLDVDTGSISQRNVNRFGGCLLGLAWNILWKPYALLIRHRSFISHAPIVGTVIRLLYVVWVPWLVWLLAAQAIPWVPIPYRIVGISPLFWWFASGLSVSDFAHAAMDQIFRKRYFWR